MTLGCEVFVRHAFTHEILAMPGDAMGQIGPCLSATIGSVMLQGTPIYSLAIVVEAVIAEILELKSKVDKLEKMRHKVQKRRLFS